MLSMGAAIFLYKAGGADGLRRIALPFGDRAEFGKRSYSS